MHEPIDEIDRFFQIEEQDSGTEIVRRNQTQYSIHQFINKLLPQHEYPYGAPAYLIPGGVRIDLPHACVFIRDGHVSVAQDGFKIDHDINDEMLFDTITKAARL
jgi:hypothetical protein